VNPRALRWLTLLGQHGLAIPMPIYEYACSGCQKAFEELIVRKSDEGEVRCPGCGSPRVNRVMSRPAASVKSGGRATGRACGPIG
jgi:putative FmdB family regulatory protein